MTSRSPVHPAISWFSFLTVLLFVLFECPWRRSCTYLSATVFLVSIPAPKVKHVQIVALNDVCTAHVSPTMSVIFHFNSSSYYSKYGKLSSRLRTFICLMDISVLIPRQWRYVLRMCPWRRLQPTSLSSSWYFEVVGLRTTPWRSWSRHSQSPTSAAVWCPVVWPA